jgi:hypothetical protein
MAEPAFAEQPLQPIVPKPGTYPQTSQARISCWLFFHTCPTLRGTAVPCSNPPPLPYSDQKAATFSTLTNMPRPAPSLVKRVPSLLGNIVQPEMRYVCQC